jgi:hypothetical protein
MSMKGLTELRNAWWVGGGGGRVKRLLQTTLLVVLAACGGDSGEAGTAGAPVAVVPDTLTLEQVRALIDSVGAPQLFERVSQPDAWYTDLFGIQPLQPVDAETVVSDLVPAHATLVDRDVHSVTLDLTDGPRVRFVYNTSLVFNGNPLDVPYARILLGHPSTYPAEAIAFRNALVDAGLGERYLLPNPYYDDERATADAIANAAAIQPVTVESDTSGFGMESHAVLMVGETHGGTESYDLARTLLRSPAVQWLGIEMMPEDLQSALTQFIEDDTTSAGWQNARTSLLDYYAANWNTRGHEITATPAENPYFLLLDEARSLGKSVYALDTAIQYILFRFGEFPLGAATRDHVWASNVPPSGRGLLYGGSQHFSPDRRPSTLTFLRDRYPDLHMYGMRAR